MNVELKRDWLLHQGPFRRLLEWLDEGVDSGGETYLEIRRRLVAYFVRKNCLTPDDLADEALTRVARRLAEEGAIAEAPPARYCYIVARFVFLESGRRQEHSLVSLDEMSGNRAMAANLSTHALADDVSEDRERRLDCLESCLQSLSPDQTDLILEYYCGEGRAKIEHRREIARRLGLTLNALANRACRIRDRLETCVKTCSATK
jgi:DNA-directed RNA polymerase specialized sigma24 family protein